MVQSNSGMALVGIVILFSLVLALVVIGGAVFETPKPGSSDTTGIEQFSGGNGTVPAEISHQVQESFSLFVSPQTATTSPGGTVRYMIRIQPMGGFDEPVHLTVSATALGGAVSRASDLGTVEPPYRTTTYDFPIPDLPPLVSEATVDARVTATGGGMTRTEQVQLVIRS